jgi:hypothetical protein
MSAVRQVLQRLIDDGGEVPHSRLNAIIAATGAPGLRGSNIFGRGLVERYYRVTDEGRRLVREVALPERMRDFFERNPDEELTRADAMVKFCACDWYIAREARRLAAIGFVELSGRGRAQVIRRKRSAA